MGDRLKGKVAIVTGGGRGLGRAEALALAAEGAKVVVNDLGVSPDGAGPSPGVADEVVAEIKGLGGQAAASFDTVATRQGAEKIIQTAIDNFGRLDILVNNAGIVRRTLLFLMSDDEWDSVIKTHLYGTFYCTRAACILFREQKGGRIINTSSEAGMGLALRSNYSAAKEGIIGFTKTVAQEMSQFGVTCNAIRPRAATRLSLNNLIPAAKQLQAAGDPDSVMKAEKIEAVRLMAPEDVAPLVVYLASDEAGYINGCVFVVFLGRITLQTLIPVKTIYTEGRWTVDNLAKIFPTTLGQDLEAIQRLPWVG